MRAFDPDRVPGGHYAQRSSEPLYGRTLGIEISLINADVKTHFSYLENKGDFDFAVSGWIADYKDPETFLGISRKASGNNFGSYNSPEFERLMDAAAAAGANPKERMKLLAQSEKILVMI
jgi:oligopeptide transport system substrate-binding protein